MQLAIEILKIMLVIGFDFVLCHNDVLCRC